MRLRAADSCGERGHVVGPVMSAAVDEECWCSGDPAEIRALDVGGDALRSKTCVEVVGEALHVEAKPPRIGDEVRHRQCVLMSEQEVMHGPERVVGGGRLCCLGRLLSVDVYVGERQVSPDVADMGEVAQQLANM